MHWIIEPKNKRVGAHNLIPKSIIEKLVPIVVLVVIAVFLAPIFSQPKALINDNPYRYHDYLQQATYDTLFRSSILEHGQFPLRTNKLGGGYPIIANPQDTSFSPFVITALIFGEALGMKINLVLFFLIGVAGMMLLVRKGLGLSMAAAAFAALAYGLSGWWTSRIEWGFYFKFYFHLFPLVFYFYLQVHKKRRALLYAAMLLVVTITQLGLGFAVIFLFLFCFDGIEYLKGIKIRKIPDFLTRLVILGLIVLALGAVRITPMVQLLAQSPRHVGAYESYTNGQNPFPDFYESLSHFGSALVSYDTTIPNTPIHPGAVTLVLALLGAVFVLKKSWKYLALLVLFTWLSFGPFALVDIWRPLFYLPLFKSMHQPYQLTNYFILFTLVILAAYAFSLTEKLPGKWLPIAASLVPFIFLAQPWMNHQPYLEKTFTKNVPVLPMESEFYQVRGKDMNRGAPRSLHSHQYYNVKRNVGTIDFDGDVLLPEFAEPKLFVETNDNQIPNPDYKGEAWLEGCDGEAKLTLLSPNRIEATGESSGGCLLVVNQNYESSWRSDLGDVVSHKGLIAVQLQNMGNFHVAFSYRPTGFYLGLVLSLFAWGWAFFLLATRKID